MKLTIADLERCLALRNVRAFLLVIRRGESSIEPVGYRMRFGGVGKPVAYFDDLSQHPRKLEPTTGGRFSSAAGAYQITQTTWSGLVAQYGFADFQPHTQDLAAVALIAGRSALDEVVNGKFSQAVELLRQEWTSLPGAAENNARWNIEAAYNFYVANGGMDSAEDAGAPAPQPIAPPVAPPKPIPQSAPPIPAQPAGAKQMPILALISAFGPVIAQLIPQLATIFAPKGEVAQRNVALAQVAFDTITRAAGAANVQDAVEKMQADPAVVETVKQAVVTQPEILANLTLTTGGEAAVKAADRGLAMQVAERPFWFNPTFWITMAFVPMMYLIVMAVLGLTNAGIAPDGSIPAGAPWYTVMGFDPSTRSGLVNLIVGFIFGGVTGVWFGTSYGSQRKTELAAESGATAAK